MSGPFIVPYFPVDGIMPFRDSAIRGLWDRMEKQKLAQTVFFDGSVRSSDQFLAFAKGVDKLFFIIMLGGTPAAFFWLDSITQRRANIHFCIFKEHWGEMAKAIGATAISAISRLIDTAGFPLLKMLCGVTPASNTRAVRFAESMGFTLCGIIPRYLYHAGTGDNIPAAILAREL